MKTREKFDTLTTEYATKMDASCPWNIYPRPSMARDFFICLNGEWDFAVTEGEAPTSYSERITVPFPPESKLSGIERNIPTDSVMYYKRDFALPKERDGRVILHFGAVDTLCRVFVNGESVFEHEGGYLPFSVDITDYVHDENTLTVAALDPLDRKYPYGKQSRSPSGMWYTPVSGIWQTVWLEIVPDKYISDLLIESYLDRAVIRVKGGVNHKRLALDSGEIFEFTGDSVEVRPSEIKNWTPDTPYLYRFTLECGEDKIRSYFALREIKIESIGGIPRLCLNGKPMLFNGLLDQGYFPDGIFLPATEEGYRDDILNAKKMGFNTLRKHIKIEPEIFYALCDELGMVVFQDMVNNGGYSFFLDTALPTVGLKRLPDRMKNADGERRDIFIRHMKETIEHLSRFPSVLYYTIFNEGWGQFCADEVYDMAKAIDGSRIYDATSGWFTQSRSDVDSRHVYFKPVKLGKLTDRPIVISEFGGYSHRVEGHLFGKKNYGYKSFDKASEFEEAFIRLYSEEILPLIPLGISALIYTQLSDVEDETNGMLTYDRRVMKVDPNKTSALMKRLYSSINN